MSVKVVFWLWGGALAAVVTVAVLAQSGGLSGLLEAGLPVGTVVTGTDMIIGAVASQYPKACYYMDERGVARCLKGGPNSTKEDCRKGVLKRPHANLQERILPSYPPPVRPDLLLPYYFVEDQQCKSGVSFRTYAIPRNCNNILSWLGRGFTTDDEELVSPIINECKNDLDKLIDKEVCPRGTKKWAEKSKLLYWETNYVPALFTSPCIVYCATVMRCVPESELTQTTTPRPSVGSSTPAPPKPPAVNPITPEPDNSSLPPQDEPQGNTPIPVPSVEYEEEIE